MRVSRFCIGLSLVVLLSVTCSRPPAEPTPPSLSLTGSWTGIVGQSMSGTALRLTWVVTQFDGTRATGTATLVKPGPNVPAAGTMNGTFSGSIMMLTYIANPGTVPGFPACTIIGSGSATATDSSITGSLSLTFASCDGSGLESTGSTQLALTRQ